MNNSKDIYDTGKKLSVISLFMIIFSTLFVGYAESKDSSGWLYTQYDDHITISDYTGPETEIIIPNAINNLPVTEIEDGAFMENDTIETVSITGNVKKIGKAAFSACSKLQFVVLLNGVETLDDYCFLSPISAVSIPASVSSIGAGTFPMPDTLFCLTEENEYAEKYLINNDNLFKDSNGDLHNVSSPIKIKYSGWEMTIPRGFSATTELTDDESYINEYGYVIMPQFCEDTSMEVLFALIQETSTLVESSDVQVTISLDDYDTSDAMLSTITGKRFRIEGELSPGIHYLLPLDDDCLWITMFYSSEYYYDDSLAQRVLSSIVKKADNS